MKFTMKVEVKSSEVTVKSGTSGKGKPYTIREQECWAHINRPFPQLMVVNLEDNQQPYPVGVYEVDESSIYIGRYGQLQFGKVKLKAVGAPARAAAG